MKTKEEIQELANEIADLEIKLKNPLDKNVQRYMRRIENIMESLNLKESLDLDGAVLEILENC